MRVAAALTITLLLAGCASEAPVGTPAMYVNMAEPGAKLDPAAAASMISQYRQNNGLGAVIIDPDLMRLAEAQSGTMAAQNKLDHDVKAPLARRLAAGGYPATRGGRKCVGGLSHAGGSLFRLARLASAQGQHAEKRCHKIRHSRQLCTQYQIQSVLDPDFGVY